jgi:hypothetical protein
VTFLNMGTIVLAIYLALLVMELVALIDAAIRPGQAYVAADKQTKQFWLILLGIGTLLTFYFGPFGTFLLGLIGVVAAAVYLLDVRPALRGIGGGRSRRRRKPRPSDPW